MRKLRKDWESVEAMMERLSIPEPNTGCFLWQGKIGTGGYAYIAYREGKKRFHRKAATVALELSGRPRPEGLVASHTCVPPNPACVNPDHLVWETQAENLARREWKPAPWKFTCDECGSTYEQIGKVRACRFCNARRAKEWREKNPDYQRNYDAANRDRINALRRARRSGQRKDFT